MCWGAMSRTSVVILDPTITYSMNTVLTWGIQLFDAIDHMHQKHKLVHRDIKPDNIFVTNEYQLKIGDFGLAKVVGDGTVTGRLIGTPRYMSPPNMKEDGVQRNVYEQLIEADVSNSHRNDVYSLGLAIWEIIERRTIFTNYEIPGVYDNDEVSGVFFDREQLLFDIALKRVTEIEPPECQSEIQKIILKCTNFQRIHRPPASEVLDLLKQTQKTNQFISSLPFMPTDDQNQKELMKPIGFDDRTECVGLKPYPEKRKQHLLNDILGKEHMEKSVCRCGAVAHNSQTVNICWIEPNNQLTTTTAQIPLEYSPDQQDFVHRKEQIPPTAFHKIGTGSATMVVAGVFRKDGERGKGEKVTMKRYDIVSLTNRTQSTFTQLLQEIQNTQYLIHPNIVTMMDSFYEEGLNRSLKFVWIITERMDHTLDVYFKHLQTGNKLRDHRNVSALFVQMFRALDFLYQRGVMHRDVRPENIGMKMAGFVIKLLDFGACGQINAQLDHTRLVLTPPIYQPLEVILERRYDCGVDIWAMGLVGMEMLGCKLMMPSSVNRRLTQPIKQQILDVIGLPNTKYQDIFQYCLSSERPRPRRLEAEIDTALDRMESDRHSSLTKANLKDLLLKLLDVNPQSRPRAYECLEHPYLLKMNQSLEPVPTEDIQNSNTRDEGILKQMLLNFSRLV
ncbi:unnamed protein product, partial [Mesorhabditis belari]|uniref:Protein kinase domain-containing protein n=1 Tax=Mesorhabditis belari TaxID=2138241 RepID=A0AAF3EXM3_9BILA